QPADQLGRERDGRPRRLSVLDAPVAFAVPARVELADSSQPGFPERRIELERTGLADRRARAVPRPLAEDEAKARVDEGTGVAGEAGALFQHERGPAPDRLQGAQH